MIVYLRGKDRFGATYPFNQRPLRRAYRSFIRAHLERVLWVDCVEKPPKRVRAKFSHLRSKSRHPADWAIKGRRKLAGGKGRRLAGRPSKFTRSLRMASRIVIDTKIRVFQHNRPKGDL